MTKRRRHLDPNNELAELTRRDVFDETTDDERAYLRSDAMCERWLVEITRVTQGVAMQLDNLAKGVGPDRDAQWEHRTRFLWTKYNRRSEEAKALVNDLRSRMRGGDTRALEGEIARLRGAIRAHERAVLDAGADPEDWDAELWSWLTRPTKKSAA